VPLLTPVNPSQETAPSMRTPAHGIGGSVAAGVDRREAAGRERRMVLLVAMK